MAKIGIITRVHESRLQLLPRAVASLAAQTWTDWELVLVAHGGVEALCELLETLPETVVQKTRVVDSGLNPKDNHNGILLNCGLKALDSEYVIPIDEDDTWDPGMLQALLEAVEDPQFPSVAGAVCQSRRIVEELRDEDWPEEVEREDLNPQLRAVTLAEMALENRFTGHALLARRTVAMELGGWSERLPLFVDWEFNLRLLGHYDIAVVPRVLANYHQRLGEQRGMGNISHTFEGNHRETARAVIVNSLLRDPKTPPALREALVAGAGNFELREEVRKCFRRLEVISQRIGRIDSRSKDLKDQLL